MPGPPPVVSPVADSKDGAGFFLGVTGWLGASRQVQRANRPSLLQGGLRAADQAAGGGSGRAAAGGRNHLEGPLCLTVLVGRRSAETISSLWSKSRR